MGTNNDCIVPGAIPPMPPNIINAYKAGKLIIFVGAGMSRLMNLPGWDQLAENLINIAYPNCKEQYLIKNQIHSPKERISIAYEKCKCENRLKEYYDAFEKAMTPIPNNGNKPNVYQVLSQFYAAFLTTNADGMLRAAFTPGCEIPIENITNLSSDDLSQTLWGHIVYLHGRYEPGKSFAEYERDLVFTASQYASKYNRPEFVQFLSKIFNIPDVVILFLGYGLNEYELIDYLITKTESSDKCFKYILEGFYSGQEVVCHARSHYLESLGVHLIPYCLDAKSFSFQIDILNQWANDTLKYVCVPLTVDANIQVYTASYSKQHAESLYSLLQHSTFQNQTESRAFSCITKDYNSWLQFFAQKEYFTSRIDLLVENEAKQWTPLQWLTKVDYSENGIREIVTNIIDRFVSCGIDKLMPCTFIPAQLVALISYLPNQAFSHRYTDWIKQYTAKRDLEWLQVDNVNWQNVCRWQNDNLFEFLNAFCTNIDDLESYNINVYSIKTILKGIALNIQSKKNEVWCIWLFDYFCSKVGLSPSSNLWNALSLEKYEDDCASTPAGIIWSLATDAFEEASKDTKTAIASRLLASKSECNWKLAIYLLRTYWQQGYSLIFNHLSKLFSAYTCHVELYKLLSLIQDFSESDREQIKTAVENATFGITNHNQIEDLQKSFNSIIDPLAADGDDGKDFFCSHTEVTIGDNPQSKTTHSPKDLFINGRLVKNWANRVEEDLNSSAGIPDIFDSTAYAYLAEFALTLAQYATADDLKDALEESKKLHVEHLELFFEHLDRSLQNKNIDYRAEPFYVSYTIEVLKIVLAAMRQNNRFDHRHRNALKTVMRALSESSFEERELNELGSLIKEPELFDIVVMSDTEYAGIGDRLYYVINTVSYGFVELLFRYFCERYYRTNQKIGVQDDDMILLKRLVSSENDTMHVMRDSVARQFPSHISVIDEKAIDRIWSIVTSGDDSDSIQGGAFSISGAVTFIPQITEWLLDSNEGMQRIQTIANCMDHSMSSSLFRYILNLYYWKKIDSRIVRNCFDYRDFAVRFFEFDTSSIASENHLSPNEYLLSAWGDSLKGQCKADLEGRIGRAAFLYLRRMKISDIDTDIVAMYGELISYIPTKTTFPVQLDAIKKLYNIDFPKAHSILCALVPHLNFISDNMLDDLATIYAHNYRNQLNSDKIPKLPEVLNIAYEHDLLSLLRVNECKNRFNELIKHGPAD